MIKKILPQELIVLDELVIFPGCEGEMDDRGYVVDLFEKENQELGGKGIHPAVRSFELIGLIGQNGQIDWNWRGVIHPSGRAGRDGIPPFRITDLPPQGTQPRTFYRQIFTYIHEILSSYPKQPILMEEPFPVHPSL